MVSKGPGVGSGDFRLAATVTILYKTPHVCE